MLVIVLTGVKPTPSHSKHNGVRTTPCYLCYLNVIFSLRQAQDAKEGFKPDEEELSTMINKANPLVEGNKVLLEEDFIAMMV